jgi:hypothetical protein
LQQIKKFSFPILFFIGLTLLLEIRFARPHSNLSFRLLIPDAHRRAIACAEAIRSVTHLVLARSGKLCLFSLSRSFPVFVWVFLAINPSAHPASAGPENVQCRSVFIQFVRALVPQHLCQATASNPFVTHGTVESPAKLFLKQIHCVN